MNENISRLMDGELDATELDTVCGVLKRSDALVTWTCYHVIGDTLRGSGALPAGLSMPFAKRFDAEPTVLAPPQRRSESGAATWVWAAAASVAAMAVVGWTALSIFGDTPAAVAKAQEAGRVNPAVLRASPVPADYLLAHQEYSPAAAIQGVGPYLRAVATPGGDRP